VSPPTTNIHFPPLCLPSSFLLSFNTVGEDTNGERMVKEIVVPLVMTPTVKKSDDTNGERE